MLRLSSRAWRILGVILFLLPLVGAYTDFGWNGDGLMDAAIGHWILVHRRLPAHNWWSVLAWGAPFRDTEWLFSVAVAWLSQWGGWWAVWAVGVGTFTLLGVLLLRLLRAWPAVWQALGLLGVGLGLLLYAVPRPQWVSYLGFAAGLVALDAWRQGRRWPVALWATAGVAVWAASHASVILAPALLASEAVWGPAPRRALWVWVGVALVVMALVPPGFGGWWVFVAHVLQPHLIRTTPEWEPLWANPGDAVLLAPWLLASWALAGPARRRGDRTAWVWALLAPWPALAAARFGAYTILGVVALAGRLLRPPTTVPRPLLIAGGFTAAALGTLLGLILTWPGAFGPRGIPPRIVAALIRARAVNVVTPPGWGDQLNATPVLPWVTGQIQLYAAAPWWPRYNRLVTNPPDQADALATLARMADPTACWLVAPAGPTPTGWTPVLTAGGHGFLQRVTLWRRHGCPAPFETRRR